MLKINQVFVIFYFFFRKKKFLFYLIHVQFKFLVLLGGLGLDGAIFFPPFSFSVFTPFSLFPPFFSPPFPLFSPFTLFPPFSVFFCSGEDFCPPPKGRCILAGGIKMGSPRRNLPPFWNDGRSVWNGAEIIN